MGSRTRTTCRGRSTGRSATCKTLIHACVCVTQLLFHSEKVPLNKALKKEESPNVPAEIKEKHEQTQEKPTVADTQEEADALRTPPDPTVPSGVLSIIIHQINNRKSSTISQVGVDR